MLFFPKTWTLAKRKTLYILIFDNERNSTPNIALTEQQLRDLARDINRLLNPGE